METYKGCISLFVAPDGGTGESLVFTSWFTGVGIAGQGRETGHWEEVLICNNLTPTFTLEKLAEKAAEFLINSVCFLTHCSCAWEL